MIYIAHRGLLDGPDEKLENSPDQITKALCAGFQAEIDLWYIDGEYLLGHDKPTYKVDINFISQPYLWIHAKNLDALTKLCFTKLNYFWHQSDDFTLTSHGFVWTYPDKPLGKQSICVLPEWNQCVDDIRITGQCFGVCSDFVERIKNV